MQSAMHPLTYGEHRKGGPAHFTINTSNTYITLPWQNQHHTLDLTSFIVHNNISVQVHTTIDNTFVKLSR